MASITPDTEVCELSLENVRNLTTLNTKRLEELFDIKVEENKKKLILVGERDNTQKAQRYLISLLKPSECICQIYDCLPENIKCIQRNLLMAERHSGCYIKKGEDSYFLVYGIDQEDVAIAISLLDAATSGKLQKFSLIDDDCVVVTSDVSMSSGEESMDLIADDDDDDNDPQLDFENNSSLEVSRMMSDIVLESQGSSPNGARHHDCTIDLRSEDEDCVVISDSPTPVKKKKKKKKKKPQAVPASAGQPCTSSNIPQTNPPLLGDQLVAMAKTNLCKPLVFKEVRSNHPEPSNGGKNFRPGSSGPRNDMRFINQFQLNVMQNNIGLLNPIHHPFERPQFPFPMWPQNLPVSFDNRNIPQLQTNQPFRTGLRKIVIDGSNIAMMHGRGRIFSCRGIQLVVDYFERRGHSEIAVFVPQWRRSRKLSENQVTNPEIMEKLYRINKLFFTPSREVDGKIISSYDDRFILKDATDEGGIVVSNDQYKDLYAKEPSFRETIERRILQVTFVGDKVMFPDDPLGRNGPSLDEFLRHSHHPRDAIQARHRSPSTISKMQQQPHKKARSSSCRAFKNNPNRPSVPLPTLNYRPSDGRNFNNPMWHRPPFGVLLRSQQVTDDLRRALNRVPYSNPQKVNKILNDHPSVVDLAFLQALL